MPHCRFAANADLNAAMNLARLTGYKVEPKKSRSTSPRTTGVKTLRSAQPKTLKRMLTITLER